MLGVKAPSAPQSKTPPAAENSGSKRGLKPKRTSRAKIALGILGPALLLTVWYAVWAAGVFDRTLFPRPDQILAAAIREFKSGDLLKATWVSTARVSVGVLIGTALAIPIGFLLAWYPVLKLMFEPMVNFFRALPPIALIPLVIVYLGIGETARVSVLVYSAFFASLVVIFEAVSGVDQIYVRAAQALGANQWEIFRKVVAPAVTPQLFVALRVALGVSWATLVAAELLAAQDGLGATIQNSANFFKIDVIYVGIAAIGCMALLMDYLIKVIMAHFVQWQERVEH